MKICYIGDGDSIHNHFMVEWFHKRGHEILFLTDTPQNAPPCEVRQVAPRHGYGYFRHLYAALNVRRAIHAWKPEMVHAHNLTGYGYWGGLAGFSPLVMTAWGSDVNVFAKHSRLVEKLISYCLKKADFITGDARDLCTSLQQLAGNQADVRLLQWGVELSRFDIPISLEIRNRFRGNADRVFISTRRLRPIYNIDVIIKAFADVIVELPHSRLIVVGNDQEYGTLQSLAKKLQIAESVLFTGWLSHDELVAALLCSDAFISVPSTDSTALSLLEAFAARLPVIIADLPANREWVNPGQNGILVPPGDQTTLSRAMIRLGKDQETAGQWGRTNRQLVETRGDREQEMSRLENWYRELITKYNRSRTF